MLVNVNVYVTHIICFLLHTYTTLVNIKVNMRVYILKRIRIIYIHKKFSCMSQCRAGKKN